MTISFFILIVNRFISFFFFNVNVYITSVQIDVSNDDEFMFKYVKLTDRSYACRACVCMCKKRYLVCVKPLICIHHHLLGVSGSTEPNFVWTRFKFSTNSFSKINGILTYFLFFYQFPFPCFGIFEYFFLFCAALCFRAAAFDDVFAKQTCMCHRYNCVIIKITNYLTLIQMYNCFFCLSF